MTSNHEYEMPTEGSVDWHLPLNRNFESLDSDIEIRDIEENLDGYSPKPGAKFFATDTGRRYLGDGSQWTEASSQPRTDVVAPHTTSDPEIANTGDIWYREDLDELRTKAGSDIVTLASGSDDTSDADQIWRYAFDTPPSEALKLVENRDWDTLVSQLLAQGWDDVSHRSHVGEGYFHTNTSVSPSGSSDRIQGEHAGEWRYLEKNDGGMGWQLEKALDADEMWAQYWVKFPSDFYILNDDFASWAHGGKLPGWETGDRSWRTIKMFQNPEWVESQFDVPDGNYPRHDNPGDPIYIVYYLYQPHTSGGNSDPWAMNHPAGMLECGHWYEITMHLALNDVGSSNAVLEGWVRREDESTATKAYENTSLELRASQGDKIHQWRHVSFFGGGWTTPYDQSAYTDDLRLYATSPL